MFLNQLSEDEKELFLDLCGHAVVIDGEFEIEEMEAIARCCYEMMVPNHMPDTEQPLGYILSELNSTASRQEINIIIIELIMLLKQDGAYEQKEIEFLNKVTEILGISEEKFEKLEKLADSYIILRNEMTDEISKEV